jgi:glycosyltransferase involved in cell wall biosynthesis
LFGKSIFVEAGTIAGTYVYLAEQLIAPVYRNTPFAVVSESTLKEFHAMGFRDEQLSIIPNCIEPTSFPMKVSKKHQLPTIAYFGRLKKYKSVDHLLRAFAIVQKQIPDAQLHILGKGNYQPQLESLARELAIDSTTTFFGFVNEEQKRDLLSKAHIVVNPSVKEGWGITNIEANACGTPIVSADSPGLRDSVAVGRSGLLYDYGDINGLAAHLISLLQNSNQLQTLSEGAVSWAEEFDWNTSAESMITLCEQVIHKQQ